MKAAVFCIGFGLAVMLTACGGGSNTSSSSSTTTMATAAATNGTVAMKGAASASDGAKVYQTNCSSCHGASGQGTPGAFPPLAGNPVVTGDPKKVIHIVKDGLHGQIAVKGQTYNGQMPAWAGQLSNADIAAAVTFIRSSWGNKASAVSEADVAATK